MRRKTTPVRYLFSVALVLAAPWIPGALAQNTAVDRLIARAQNAEDSETQIHLYSEAIRQAPDYWLAWAYRAEANVTANNFEAAVLDSTKALKLNPGHAGLHALRAEAHRLAGRPAQAVEDATAALRLEPRNAMALRTRGAARMALNEPAAALQDLDAALVIESDNVFARDWRTRALATLERYAEALLECQHLARLSPQSADPYELMARIFLSQDQLDDALRTATTAKRLAPANPDVLNLLASIQYEADRFSEAIDTLNALLSLKPDHADAFAMRGEAYRLLGEFARAVDDTSKALQLDNGNAAAPATRGAAYAGLEQWDRAIADLSDALRRNPENSFALRARMHVHVSRKAWDAAQADGLALLPKLDNDTDRSTVLTTLGVAYRSDELLEQAENSLTLAIKLHEANAEAYFQRALTYRMAGLNDEALSDCQVGLQRSPEDAFGQLVMGVVSVDLGHHDTAEESLDRVIAADAGRPYAAWAHTFKSESLRQREQYESSIASASAALGSDPREAHAMAHLVRAASRRQIGLFREAIADCTGAIRIDSTYAYAYAERAAARRALSEYNAALADCDQSISLAPVMLLAYHERAHCILATYRGDGYPASSKRVQLPVIRGVGGFDPPMHLVSSMRPITPEATRKERRSQTQPRPYIPEPVEPIAKERETHPLDPAVLDFRMLLNLGFEPLSSAAGLAACLWEMERIDECKAVCDEAINGEGEHAELLLIRAQAQFALGAVQAGLRDATDALDFAEDLPAARLTRAYGYALSGRWGECRRECERCLESEANAAVASWSRLLRYSAALHQDVRGRESEYMHELDTKPGSVGEGAAGWPAPLISALARGGTLDVILAEIAKETDEHRARRRLCQGMYYAAARELGLGRVSVARELLHRALQTGARQTLEYWLADAELQRLGR